MGQPLKKCLDLSFGLFLTVKVIEAPFATHWLKFYATEVTKITKHTDM